MVSASVNRVFVPLTVGIVQHVTQKPPFRLDSKAGSKHFQLAVEAVLVAGDFKGFQYFRQHSAVCHVYHVLLC